MIAILTGDIVNSRKVDPSIWLDPLRNILTEISGNEEVGWEIFRGDSFQLKCAVAEGFLAVLKIKSMIRQFKPLDIRIGIGIGSNGNSDSGISQSFGEAFQRSGSCFDSLKKRRLGIFSGDNDFDRRVNLVFDLISLTMDQWSKSEALMISIALRFEGVTQEKLAEKIGTSQANVSSTLNRAAFEEVMRVNTYYIEEITELCRHS